MSRHSLFRPLHLDGAICASTLLLCLGTLFLVLQPHRADAQKSQQASTPMVLDHVVAVVNNHAILASDLQEEMRLATLDLTQTETSSISRRRALDQLISQTLIEQQIRQEDLSAINPTQAEINRRLTEIRHQLPACMRQDCTSDAGWKAFLAKRDLTPNLFKTYLRNRLLILRFIELRFRQEVSISREKVAAYYKNKLLPRYSPGAKVPTLAQVAPRIREILLQQHVNLLFDDWLKELREQGDVEILDPSLEAPQTTQVMNGGKEGGK